MTIFLGLIYAFIGVVMYIAERRKDFINRILRLQDSPDVEVSDNINSVVKKINSWIRRNNLSWNLKEFSVILFVILTSILLMGLLVFKNIIISVLLSFFIIYLFFLSISIRSRKENSKKEIQFEQFLLDLAANLYGDPNILNCIEKTVDNTRSPLRWDIEKVVNDTKRGLLLKQALENMIGRSSSPAIRVVLTGLIAADEKGIDLIEYVKDQIEYLREKISLGNYIKILSSGPKYTAYLIMTIPLTVLIILIIINKSILEILLSGPGIMILIYIVISNIIGFCLINKIVNFHGGKSIIR